MRDTTTALGAFRSVTLGFFDFGRKDYERIPIDEQVEVLSLVGDFASDEDGEVALHAHVVVGKRDGSAHGGHLLAASVRPTLEAMVVDAPAELRRGAYALRAPYAPESATGPS